MQYGRYGGCHANPMKFGLTNLSRKSLKLLSPDVSFKAKMQKKYISTGSATDLAGGTYSTSPDSLAGIKGTNF